MSLRTRKLWEAKLSGNLPEKGVKFSKSNKSREISEIRKITGKKFSGVVLGIDPSLRGTGLSVVEIKNGSLRYLASTTIKNRPAVCFSDCLGEIFRITDSFIKLYKPVCAAIESSVYVQNFRIAMTLGSARGAAIAAVASAGLEIFEYPPLRIKQAVIGYGRASKEQVSASVKSLIPNAPLLPFDEADATAAALTHIFTFKS